MAPKTPSPQKRKRGARAAAVPTASPATPQAKGKGKAAAAAAAAAAAVKPKYGVDPECQLAGAAVHGDYSAMLNQTNVGANNNKFYRLQLLKGAPRIPHASAAPRIRAVASGWKGGWLQMAA